MYSIDGEFGQIRPIRRPIGQYELKVPFYLESGGWHRCNDKYKVEHKDGYPGHSLYFSISDGGRIHLNNGGPIMLPASSIIWVPPHCKHRYYTAKDQIWEFYWVYISKDSLLEFESLFADTENNILILKNADSMQMEFNKMLGDRNWNIQNFQIDSSKMISNIYHLLLQEKEQQMAKRQNMDMMILDMIKEMENSYADPIQLPSLSQKYFISVPQLIRRFKKETQMTPHEYLTVLRIRKAEEFLRYSSMSIEEISKKTGFQSTSNFIAQFRKLQNITPGQYRKEIL